MKKLIFVFALCMMAAAVAFAGSKAPEWKDNPNKKYPADSFIVGVGEGSDRKVAENDALSQISKQIEVKIKSVITDKQAEEITGKGGKSAMSNYSESFSKVSTSETQKVLEGVSFPEAWEDKDAGKTCVLAALDRTKASTLIKDKITALDSELAKIAAIVKAENAVLDIKNLKKAQKLAVQREAINSDLRVISPEGAGIEPKDSASSIGRKIDEAMQNLKVGVKLTGNSAEIARNAIADSLTGAGFSIFDLEAGKLDVLIKGVAEVEEVSGADPNYDWAVSKLSADLVDQKSGRVFGRVSERTREGAKGKDRARDTATRKLSKKVAEQVGAKFLEYIEK
jgi:hypothetical protein